MNIPFIDLQAQYQQVKQEINDRIQTVLNKQIFIMGKELELFEQEFANYLSINHAVGVASGTDALVLALQALGVGKGDEVITTPHSFIATTIAITSVGATPIFVDIDPKTYQIDASKIEEKITKRTKVILPVHIYGAACEIDKIMSIAKKNKLYVIEDAAQAAGSHLRGQKLGTFADLAIFSFYPGKNLGAYGDAGMIVTKDAHLHKKLLLLRNYGQTKKYHHVEIGTNSRLDEIQAAVLSIKLKNLDKWNQRRNEIMKLYQQGLKKYHMQTLIKGSYSNYHLAVIKHPNRAKFMDQLEKKGIHTLIHYPVPIHLQPCYTYLGFKKGDFPLAEELADTCISLPMYAELSDLQVDYIINTINSLSS